MLIHHVILMTFAKYTWVWDLSHVLVDIAKARAIF